MPVPGCSCLLSPRPSVFLPCPRFLTVVAKPAPGQGTYDVRAQDCPPPNRTGSMKTSGLSDNSRGVHTGRIYSGGGGSCTTLEAGRVAGLQGQGLEAQGSGKGACRQPAREGGPQGRAVPRGGWPCSGRLRGCSPRAHCLIAAPGCANGVQGWLLSTRSVSLTAPEATGQVGVPA